MTASPDSMHKATLTNKSVDAATPIKVLYNPSELTVTTNMLYPDISVPGLRVPLTQFVRGEARTLACELFLDQSTTGESLATCLRDLRNFVTINGDLHAPPVVEFAWGDTQFTGVVIEFSEKFQMFDQDGHILRARVTVKLKAYEPSNLQYREINQQSPDRTKTRTARAGDRYDLIAAQEYGDPALWPVLSDANGDDHPRLLAPGDLIVIPSL
jgi:hypothetical protein